MNNLAIYLLGLSALSASVPARHVGGLHDLEAFPRYEVRFLGDLPIASSDAERCKRDGLAHDDDFLSVRISDSAPAPLIEGVSGKPGDGGDVGSGADSDSTASTSTKKRRNPVSVVPLLFTHQQGDGIARPYLCAMPSRNLTAPQLESANRPHDEPEPDAVSSWRALSHLNDQCLYHRQGWFTYAYCHNSHIRQFRELLIKQPHAPGGYVPQEDPNNDAYMLGRAHKLKRAKAALPYGQRRAAAAAKNKGTDAPGAGAVERGGGGGTGSKDIAPELTATFGVGPASRYLVQHWGDGTQCDKTGKPRKVEVQVHCSLTSSDMIYMIKEVAICEYVVVIHSPHLCSLPGFRPVAGGEDIPSAPIRCREVLDDGDFERWEEAMRAGPQEPAPAAAGTPLGLPEREVAAAAAPNAPPDAAAKDTKKGRQHLLGGTGEGTNIISLDDVSPEMAEQINKLVKAAFGADDERYYAVLRGDVLAEAGFGYGEDDVDGAVDAEGAARAGGRPERGTAAAAADAPHPPRAPAADAGVDAPMPEFVVAWDRNEAGDRVPRDIESVPPSTGEDRRAFLQRLQQYIADELAASRAEKRLEQKARLGLADAARAKAAGAPRAAGAGKAAAKDKSEDKPEPEPGAAKGKGQGQKGPPEAKDAAPRDEL